MVGLGGDGGLYGRGVGNEFSLFVSRGEFSRELPIIIRSYSCLRHD